MHTYFRKPFKDYDYSQHITFTLVSGQCRLIRNSPYVLDRNMFSDWSLSKLSSLGHNFELVLVKKDV